MGVVRDFFSNWRDYEATPSKKLALTVLNRFRSTGRLRTCCGHHGEPGC